MGDLKLSREHVSRLVTLDRRLQIIENKQIANLTEDRLITIEENGLVEDMLVFLDQVEFPQRDLKAHHEDNQGAAAGATKGSKKSMAKWLGLATAFIALLTIGFLFWPDGDKTLGNTSITVKERVPPLGDTTSAPRLTDEERKKEAQRLDEKRKEDLRQQELLKERERQKRLAAAKKEQEAAANVAFMTPGEQLVMTLAVYAGTKSTSLNSQLTKSLEGFLQRVLRSKDIDAAALTKAFHDSKERQLLTSGRSSSDKRLSARRARYIVLADISNINREGKGRLRMCIYDTSTGKPPLIRTEPAAQMQEEYILSAVKAFIVDEIKL